MFGSLQTASSVVVRSANFTSNLRRFTIGAYSQLFSTDGVALQPVRGVTKQEAKRYWAEDGTFDPPVTSVIDRFKRLRWGAFIHPRAGRRKHLYRKNAWMIAKKDEHILTNRATSFNLDNMLNAEWRKPRYFPEDIYEPYHRRTGVPWDYQKKRFYP